MQKTLTTPNKQTKMENRNEKTQTLPEGLLEEMNRVRELITEYKSLHNGAGMIGAGLMTVSIRLAEKAISEGNVIEMLVQYENLKSHTG